MFVRVAVISWLCLSLLLPLLANETMKVKEMYQPLALPAPASPPAYVPFADLPSAPLDEEHNGIGAAQQIAREYGAQGRVLWIDGLANIDRINSAEKIQALVTQVKAVGFNTVVLDVKPISGLTLYPSAYAPKVDEWRNATLPADFDPLAELLKDGHAAGLNIVTSMNVFAEGHRLLTKGPGFMHPEWQSTLLEPDPVLFGAKGMVTRLVNKCGTTLPDDAIAVGTSLSELPLTAASVVAIVDGARKVVATAQGSEVMKQTLPVPKDGGVLAADGAAGDFLRDTATLGATLIIDAAPSYVTSAQSSVSGVPLWTNPNNPQVQQRILEMLTELATKYPIDGVIFDDRMRYAGINADFSEETRKAFDAYVGKELHWPYDVLKPEVSFPSLSRRLLPGPYYEQWQLWRALTIRNWLARAVTTVKGIRPTASVSVYVGSWYGDYFNFGSNWASTDFQAGFRALTDDYRKTGFAGMLDWVTTGCYYPHATVSEAGADGTTPGATIEAAGQLSNRCVNDDTWVYAGISLDQFYNNPDGLARALQAAAASTQGVMVFDLSHKIEQFWPVFQKAFSKPAQAPHAVPGLLEKVHAEVARRRAAGIVDPPVIVQNGVSGTGL